MVHTLSDHRHILFALRGSLPARMNRYTRVTKWGFLSGGTAGLVEKAPDGV
jgi:hypothetical protein